MRRATASEEVSASPQSHRQTRWFFVAAPDASSRVAQRRHWAEMWSVNLVVSLADESYLTSTLQFNGYRPPTDA